MKVVNYFFVSGPVIYLIYIMVSIFQSGDQALMLNGEATNGHYMFEENCQACHIEPFSGTEGVDQGCLHCHKDELELIRDTHPEKIFRDPRNADILRIIDATSCSACHYEHDTEDKHGVGISVSEEFCTICHDDIGSKSSTHEGIDPDSCMNSGCHNYHDNRFLNYDFVSNRIRFEADNPQFYDESNFVPDHDSRSHKAMNSNELFHKELICSDCHTSEAPDRNISEDTCINCHNRQYEEFTKSKHGIRNSMKLPPISSELIRHDIISESENFQHGCYSCHSEHKPDDRLSCLNCHEDQHSLSYENSPHSALMVTSDNEGSFNRVDCVTCHMMSNNNDERNITHNVDKTLNPNIKMVPSVCLQCHTLQFSIDSLADRNLIRNNFNRSPVGRVQTIDWHLEKYILNMDD